VGTGGSREAAYALKADVPAGTYHCIIDSIIIRPVDVTFELLWRHADGHDSTLGIWNEHFDPNEGANFDAQPYEKDVEAPAIDFADGDQLVFRYTGMNASVSEAYIPNGDGAGAHGRIPSFTLPK
jgi:hypothetical protein